MRLTPLEFPRPPRFAETPGPAWPSRTFGIGSRQGLEVVPDDKKLSSESKGFASTILSLSRRDLVLEKLEVVMNFVWMPSLCQVVGRREIPSQGLCLLWEHP